MKRTKEMVLEKDSLIALAKLLPSEWIISSRNPDFGIDVEIIIVENEIVTPKIIFGQLKATTNIPKNLTYSLKTDHLNYYEGCKLPVVILYWIKENNEFYYLFAQKYIKEILSVKNPSWKEQKTNTLYFSGASKLKHPDQINDIAVNGQLYIFDQHTQNKKDAVQYYLDGIPQSDKKELKEKTAVALYYIKENNYLKAIGEFEDILKTCVLSHSERTSVRINMGNCYYEINNLEKALENYKVVLKVVKKVNEKEAREEMSIAYGNIGLIYRDKGKLDKALKYLKDALKIFQEIREKEGETNSYRNIGLIYHDKGKLDKALKYFKDALKISKEIGEKEVETNAYNEIGLIYHAKGKLDKALKYFKDALQISQEIGDKKGKAIAYGNIGTIYHAKGKLDKALKYYKDALKIHQEIGDKQGKATQVGNIGSIYGEEGELDEALKYLKDALKIHQEIGDKKGEANRLDNIGFIYHKKDELDKALKYIKNALKISQEIGDKQGEATQSAQIGLIYGYKGELDEAMKYLKDALKISNQYNLQYEKSIIINIIKKIEK